MSVCLSLMFLKLIIFFVPFLGLTYLNGAWTAWALILYFISCLIIQYNLLRAKWLFYFYVIIIGVIRDNNRHAIFRWWDVHRFVYSKYRKGNVFWKLGSYVLNTDFIVVLIFTHHPSEARKKIQKLFASCRFTLNQITAAVSSCLLNALSSP